MRRIMMMGPVGSGKTSLIQRLRGEQMHYIKTQSVEFDGWAIDTPGEYIENKQYLCALTVTACEADIIVFTQDATNNNMWYSPGQASMFNAEAIGVITKVDIADPKQIDFAKNALHVAGIKKVFEVSSAEGTGIGEVLNYIAGLDAT